MIKINNLNKRFGKREVLKKLNIVFPNQGLVGIVGESGCGKTTFLNCIANLYDYDGEINIDNVNISKFSEKDKYDYRIKNIGFIFQDFKLFQGENIKQNVLFPLECLSNLPKKRKNRMCDDLLELVGMHKNKNKRVKDLSGGEKQRIAIARALINNPKIILADEPTGSLDSENSIQIMQILHKISCNSLVLVVSHDFDLIAKYADVIVHFENGMITKSMYYEKQNTNMFLPFSRISTVLSKPHIKIPFLVRHSRESSKVNKLRNRVSLIMISLGLICSGLSLSINRLISNSVKSVYSSIVDTNKIMVTSKGQISNTQERVGDVFNHVEKIAHKYNSYIKDIGVYYENDFENMFPQCNEIRSAEGPYSIPINDLTIRNVNEFELLGENDEIVYPNDINELKDDEIILGINMPSIERICYSLKIERTLTSFSNYLKENDFHIVIDVENDDWSYSDQQIFTVKGFKLRQNNSLIHSNRRWNEYVLENQMRFPTSEKNNGVGYPWALSKIYYFHVPEKRDEFIEEFYSDILSDGVDLEIATDSFYPILNRKRNIDLCNRVLCYKNMDNENLYRYSKYISNLSPNIKNEVFGTDNGYCIFPDYLMMGFAKPVYCSLDEKILDDIEDLYKVSEGSVNYKEELPDYVVSGHYSKTMQNGLIFQSFAEKNATKYNLLDYNDIVISSALAAKIGSAKVGDTLKLLFTISETKLLNESTFRTYKRIDLKIVGIENSNKLSIFHRPFWSIGFFQSKLGISIKDLKVKTICYDCDKNSTKSVIEKITKSFPQFETKNPMEEIDNSVDEICKWISVILIVCSLTSTIIAGIILSISNYLNALQNKKDIGLARCIGLSKKESSKLVYFQSFYLCFQSFALSSVELFVLNLVSSIELSNNLSVEIVFEVNLLPYAVMFIISFAISFISSFFICKKTNKFETLECLKY